VFLSLRSPRNARRPARGFDNRQETVMQDAFIGIWAQESHLSADHLNSLRDLNHRFLDLAGASVETWPGHGRHRLPADIAGRVAPLSRAQRAAAANCPYALFDLRFEDGVHWRARLQESPRWQVADEPGIDGDTMDFVRLALFYAWHVASRTSLAAQLLLGMTSDTAAAFRRITVDGLLALVATEAANLTIRWSDCGSYWNALVGAAARTDEAALRRAQLRGLQLAAASRLSSA
jgi:hypothetical protein